MSNLTHGMNVDQVEELGRFLQTKAAELDALAGQLDGKVRASSWIGQDSDRFRNQWWPDHRQRVHQMAEQIKGFGQSALNNASEQRKASGAGPATRGPGGTFKPGQGGPSGPAPAQGGKVGGTSGELPNSHRSTAEAQKAYEDNGGTQIPAYRYQCVAWALARWKELGWKGPIKPGNGWQQAGNYGGTTATKPTLGAMLSTDYGHNHVMIVEEVRTDPSGHLRVRVSEMNTGSDVNVGRPEEYRDNGWLIQDSAGNWSREGGGSYGQLTVANMPG